MVSIIIITHNSAGDLPVCLQALAGLPAELIVVDNASADASVEIANRFGARVIANGENRGFAGAANQGAHAASGGYLLYLNPDAVLKEGFDHLVGALENDPGAAAASGLLLDPSGAPQIGFNVRRFPTFTSLAFEVLLFNRLWPGNPVNRRYRCLDVPLDRACEVEQPAGACLLVRRSVLEALGGWDERFFPVWFEDVDLCLRLHRAGRRIRFEPACRLGHRGAHSVSRLPFAEKQFFWYRNLVCFVRKHMGSRAALAMKFLVFAGASARLILSSVTPGRQETWSAYRSVIRFALSRNNEGLPSGKA